MAAAQRPSDDDSVTDLSVELRLEGEAATRQPLDVLAHLDLDRLTPISRPPAYRGRLGYQGFWWSSSLGRHVGFSTLSEADLLIQLDYSNRYTNVLHNPFRLRWASSGARGSHTAAPSYLAWAPGGPADAVFKAALPHASVTTTLAALAGIRVLHPADSETTLTNLRWLAAFRFSTCQPDEATRQAIKVAVERASTFQSVRRLVSHELRVQPPDVSTWICNMLWHREVRAPLDRELLRGKTPLEVTV